MTLHQQEPYQNPPKIEELESIRGLAALLVVFFHIPKWSAFCDIGIIDNAYLMVDLFFVLSGFVIFNAYTNKISSPKDLLRFQFLRFGRLYPVHFVFLLVYLLMELAKYLAQIKFGIQSPTSIPFKGNNLEAFIENVLLIQSIFTNTASTFNYPSWSISVEFYTYLVFGLAILFFNQLKIYIFSVLAFASLIMLATKSTLGFDNLLRCYAGFFAGCLTASAIRNSKILVPHYLSTLIFISIVAFLQLKTTKDFDISIYLLTATLIASLILSPKGLLNKVLSSKVLTWLGALSYSVYMSHAAIIWVVNQFFRVVLKRPEMIDADGIIHPKLSTVEALIACAVIFLAVLIVSQAMYTIVERPFREKSRRIAFSKLS